MFDKIKNLLKDIQKPTLVTLNEYIVEFCTVDGEKHISPSYLIDEDMITCSFIEFFLICKDKYLKDKNGVMYPINNIISITAIKVGCVKNVIQQYIDRTNHWRSVWYSDYEIEEEN
jgi:hypothetical protein